MNIFEFIEHVSLDRTAITPDIRRQIVRAYDIKQWLDLTRVFLRGLDKQHQVPGKDIQRLYDYLNYHQERDNLTWEQHWHLVAIVIDNWNQMSCKSRAELYI